MLFDYFKETFRTNRANKELYGPQIALILVRMAAVAGMGIWLYIWLAGSEVQNFLVMGINSWQAFQILLRAAGFGALGLVLWLLVVRLVEAGLYSMYKAAVLSGSVPPGTFRTGVARFFLPFVLGDLAIALIFLIISPIWLVVGFATLFIGFALFAIVAGVFLMFWKVSLVWNSRGIIEAVKDSFRFARRNLAGVTGLYIMRRAFSAPMGGGNPTISYNFSSGGGVPGEPITLDPSDVLHWLRIGVSVLTPILVIVVAVYSLIKMIFDVFFGLALFVSYKHDFQPEGRGQDVV